MPRPSTSDPRSLLLRVRFTPDEMRRLDERRGTVSRSVYIRDAVLGDAVSVDAEPVADYPIGPKAVAEREVPPFVHVDPDAQEVVPEVVDGVLAKIVKVHRHHRVKDGQSRRGPTMGSTEHHYVCAEPGCTYEVWER